MVASVRLTPAQARLPVDADDQADFRLRAVLAGRANLDVGDQGPGVRLVQRLLRKAGASIDADGEFGPRTRSAVEQFQRRHQLSADGVVGRATLTRLLRETRPAREPLKLGDGGARVEAMERNLNRLGYLDRSEIGGRFDKDTALAIRQFRRDQPELSDRVSGTAAGTPTQQALAREVEQLQHAPERGRARRTEDRVALDHRTAVAVRTQPLGPGDDRHAVVANVQRHLTAAGYDPQHTGGQFDERTQAALRAFQRRSSLPATGEVDSATWQKLRGAVVLAKDGTSPAQRLGERSSAVLRTERLLDRAGYDPGRVDGKFDRGTLHALHEFERDHPRAGRGDQVGDRQLAVLARAARNPGVVRPIAHAVTAGSEFGVQDAEGAPASSGRRYHAAKDWFAPGGSRVRSPIDGTIVEAHPSRGNSGQVFGGTVKVQGRDGKVWVFRHVNPADVHVGQRVQAGRTIARVTSWADGPSHAHIELWKTLSGGYDYENMIDPMRYLGRFA